MPKDMTSIHHDRLSRIMAFLQSRAKASHDEIFAVGEYKSNRTFQNDLCYLRGIYGANIKYDPHEKLYFMESAGTFYLNLKITKQEITALTADLSMAAHFLPHLEDSAKSLWAKFNNYIPEEIISLGSEIVKLTMMSTPTAKINPEIFNILIEAKYNKKAIDIIYSAPGKEPKKWTLSPYDFYFRGNAWYMASYNHKYKNLGVHRVSRIIRAKFSSEKYISPDTAGFTEDYILSARHVIPGFEKNFIRVRITEGGVILTAEVPSLYEVAR